MIGQSNNLKLFKSIQIQIKSIQTTYYYIHTFTQPHQTNNPTSLIKLNFKPNQIYNIFTHYCYSYPTITMHLKPNPQDSGVITKDFLKKLCRSDFRQYYSTPSLNDILYLHYKGFEKIDNLQEFTGLKVIYLEGNAIKKIENLEKLETLRCLYLQENLIREITGLDMLVNLVNLNLSDNLIEKVDGLKTLTKLSTFQIKRNRIGADGLTDLIGLLECPSISALDISDNKIDSEDVIPEILQKMPNLSVVYMQNNGFNKKVSHYRKTLISKIPTLKYIDDKPVFDDEKRFADAWARGGLEEERKERALYKKQEEQKQIRQHEEFRAMIDRFKSDKNKKQEESEESSENLSDSQEESLDTYNTPTESKQGSERTSQHQSESDSERPSQNDKSSNLSESENEQKQKDKQGQQTQKQNQSSTEKKEQAQKEKVDQPKPAEVIVQKTIEKKQQAINKSTQPQRDSSRYLDELD